MLLVIPVPFPSYDCLEEDLLSTQTQEKQEESFASSLDSTASPTLKCDFFALILLAHRQKVGWLQSTGICSSSVNRFHQYAWQVVTHQSVDNVQNKHFSLC